MSKKTVGQEAYERLCKEDEKIDAWNLMEEMTKDLPEKLYEQAHLDHEIAKDLGLDVTYILFTLKRHPKMPNAIHQRLESKIHEPKMRPEAAVFEVIHKSKEVYLLWTLPPFEVCRDMLQDPEYYGASHKHLMGFVKKFAKENPDLFYDI